MIGSFLGSLLRRQKLDDNSSQALMPLRINEPSSKSIEEILMPNDIGLLSPKQEFESACNAGFNTSIRKHRVFSSLRQIALFAGAAASTLISNPAYPDPAANPANFSRTTAGALATTVPDGVCGFSAIVVGGGGGSSTAAAGTGGQGGGAASIRATFKALPLHAVLGAVASGGLAGAAPTGGTGTQAGGTGGAITSATIHRGSGGGGSTSLSVGGVQLIVAAGGGGGGAAHGNTPNANGGNGGTSGIAPGIVALGVNGSNGANTTTVGGVLGTVGGGQGGQTAVGGTGGVNSINASENGFAGTAAGAGGNGGIDTGTDSAGGGGAGFTGGGGGASTNGDSAMGGGGGGGSSFVRGTSPTVAVSAPTSVSGTAMPSAGSGALPGATGSMALTWVPCLYTLSVAKSVSAPTVNAGGRVVWTVSVTNTGPDPMTRGDTLTLTDTLPAGPNGAPAPAFRVLSIGTSGGSNTDMESGAVTCSGLSVGGAMPSNTTCIRPYSALSAPGAPSGGIRGLNSGETLTITYEQIIANTAACSTITNTATVVDRTSAGSTTTRTGSSPLAIDCYDLAITKSVSPTVAGAGQVLTWNLSVTNNGPANMVGPDDTAANSLIVTDAAPVANVSTPTAFTSVGPAGACSYVGSIITCPSSLASGQTQAFTFQQTVSATAASGAVIANTASVTDFRAADSNDSAPASATVPPATVTITKVSVGGAGGFTFNGDNGFGAAQTITTIVPGAGISAATRTLSTAGAATTITESIPAGYTLASATCTGLGTGGTATPNLATGALVLDSAATAAGSSIACVFTNTKLPTVTLTKVSIGGAGGFTFNGDNGFGAAQTITTAVSGFGVSGAPRTLAAVGAATTITESIPVGYALASATCTGLGAGGTATPNLAAGTITLDSASTSVGSAITCTFTNGVPQFSIAKSVDLASVSAPGPLAYQITVTNNGAVNLTNPVLTDALTQGGAPRTLVTGPTLVSGDLAPVGVFDIGESWTYAAAYLVTQSDIDNGGPLSNTATFDTDQTAPLASNAATTSIVQSRSMIVVKTAVTVNFVLVGDLVAYEYLVTNTGNVTLTNPVTVSDNRVTPVICPALPGLGLAPGAAITCTAVYALLLEDLDIGSVTNLASATSGATTSPQTFEIVPSGAMPALTVVKSTVTGSFNNVGDVVAYSFLVTNSGNATITRLINVTDDKIGAITCFTPTGADPTFTPTETATCTANYTVTQVDLDAGFVTNQAFASTTYGLASVPVTSPPDSLTVNAVQDPQLTVTKSAATLPVTAVGQVLTYTINVDNTGDVTVSTINVSDPLIPSLSCTIASLAPGATDNSCTGTYTVTQADFDAGAIVNMASAAGVTPQGAPVYDKGSLSTPITQVSSLELLKGVTFNDESGDGNAQIGETLSYHFTVSNTGNTTLTNIAITDPSVTVVGGPLASLGVGASDSSTFTASYTLTTADLTAGSHQNQAVSSADSPLAGPISDTSDSTNPADETGGGFDPTTILLFDAPILAAADTPASVNGATGNPSVVNAFDNDALNGVAVVPAEITATVLTPASNPGVVLDPATGLVSVAPGTPAGTYTITYQICENLNPANCSSADVTVIVDAAPILANDDAGNSDPLGGTVAGLNVLTNDTLNGVAVVPAGVTIVPVTTGPLTVNADGTVTVAPGTPAGPYTVTYQVCEVLNPANCDTADVIITVNAGNIAADADTVSGVNGLTGAADVLDVLPGDTLNGSPATLANVTMSVLTPAVPLVPGAPVPALNVATGLVSVPADTPAGTYTITYQICENLNPANCAVATATVGVTAAPIVAADDAGSSTPLGGVVAGLNVLTNDTLNGVAVVPADVTIVPVTTGPLTVNADGTVTVAPGTPAGPYTVTYQVCEVLNPANCGTGTVTVNVAAGVGSLAGTIFEDSNSNGLLNVGEPVQGGYTVQLFRNGLLMATTTSLADGSYLFSGIEPGSGYTIAATSPTGTMIAGQGSFSISAGQNITDVNLPIDPSGIVYDGVTRLPVAGATLRLTTSAGAPLPAVCFVSPGQQNQVTGVTGAYRFDIAAGAAPECPVGLTLYRLAVTSPSGYVAGVAASIPAQTGALNPADCIVDPVAGGSCQVQPQPAAPLAGASTVYFLSFLIGAGSPDIVHNHVPLDPVPVVPPLGLTVEKTAGVKVARRGDVIVYQIKVRNPNAAASGPLDVVDQLPAGFAYTPGSSFVAGLPLEPAIANRKLTFTALTVPASGELIITLNVRVASNAAPGDHVNIANAIDPATGDPLGTTGSALVRIEMEHVFDCGDVIGKVFDDRNRNGYQDEGEPGLPGVRVATVKGVLITTDGHGRFNVPCAELPDADIGSNFILKLDTRTLPTGYRMTTENPRMVRLTAGKVTKLNFGAAITKVVRIDLRDKAFEPGSNEPTQALLTGIDTLLDTLREDPSVLRLSYYAGGADRRLASARLKAVESIVQKQWRTKGGPRLAIETRVVAAK